MPMLTFGEKNTSQQMGTEQKQYVTRTFFTGTQYFLTGLVPLTHQKYD